MINSDSITKRQNEKILPPGWRWVKLGEVCEIIAGQSPPSTTYRSSPEGLPFFQGKADFGRLYPIARMWCIEPAKTAQPGDILISVRAPVGPTNVANVRCCIGRGLSAIRCRQEVDRTFVLNALRRYDSELIKKSSGSTFDAISRSDLENLIIPLPSLPEQKRIAAILTDQMEAVEKARAAVQTQLEASKALQFSYIRASLTTGKTSRLRLGDCLIETKAGVGSYWRQLRLFGATRDGLAPAKEPVGKAPERYKLLSKGTVFYNPMRIMIGSIALVDDDSIDGMTSPDYVVCKTQDGILHYRWFYHWLKSPYGEQYIRSLARGAVRERMLFTRLASGMIDVPQWPLQVAAAENIRKTKSLVSALTNQLSKMNALPAALLRRAFKGEW